MSACGMRGSLRGVWCTLAVVLAAAQLCAVAHAIEPPACEAKDLTGPGDDTCALFYFDGDGPESLVEASSAPGRNADGVYGVFVVGGIEGNDDGSLGSRTNTVWFVPGGGTASDEAGHREWDEVEDPVGLPPISGHCLVAPTPNVLLAIGGNTDNRATSLVHVFRSTDGGESWAVANVAGGGGFTGRRLAGAACVHVGGQPRCYVVGGVGIGNVEIVDMQVTSDMGATWAEAPGSPPFEARHQHSVVGRGSSVYVFGGITGLPGSGTRPKPHADAHRYDATLGTWTTLSNDSPHFSRIDGVAVAVGGTIFFGFGVQPSRSGMRLTSTLLAMDDTDTVTTLGTCRAGQFGRAAATLIAIPLDIGFQLSVVGGYDAPGVVSSERLVAWENVPAHRGGKLCNCQSGAAWFYDANRGYQCSCDTCSYAEVADAPSTQSCSAGGDGANGGVCDGTFDSPPSGSESGDGDGDGSGPGDSDGSGSGPGGFDGSGSGPGDSDGSGSGPGFDGSGSGPGGFDGSGSGPGDFDGSGSGPGGLHGSGSGPGGFDGSGSGPGGFDGSGSGPGGFGGSGSGPGGVGGGVGFDDDMDDDDIDDSDGSGSGIREGSTSGSGKGGKGGKGQGSGVGSGHGRGSGSGSGPCGGSALPLPLMGEGGASRPPCPSEDDDDVDDDGVDSGDDDRDEKDGGGVVVGDGDDDVIVGSGVGGIVGQRDGKEGGDRVADGRLTGVGNTSESSTLVVVAAGLGGAVAVVGVCGAAYCICMRRRDALKQRVPSTVSRAEPVVDPEQPRAPLSIDTSAHKRGVSQGTAQSTPYSAAASLSGSGSNQSSPTPVTLHPSLGSDSRPRSAPVVPTLAGESWIIPASEITIEERVGGGAFGMVWRGTYAGSCVALKQLFAGMGSEAALTELKSEATLLSQLHHPNVLHFYGVCVRDGDAFLVTEFCPDNLINYLIDNARDHSLPTMVGFAVQVVRAMRYLHSKGVIHRDLKPDNLLLTSSGEIRVCDFGLARVQASGSMSVNKGTPAYMAPETMGGVAGTTRVYTNAVDVYSFGVVLWVMATRRQPFGNVGNPFAIPPLVVSGVRPPIPPTIPGMLADVIQACWSGMPASRPTFEQVEGWLLSRNLLGTPDSGTASPPPKLCGEFDSAGGTTACSAYSSYTAEPSDGTARQGSCDEGGAKSGTGAVDSGASDGSRGSCDSYDDDGTGVRPPESQPGRAGAKPTGPGDVGAVVSDGSVDEANPVDAFNAPPRHPSHVGTAAAGATRLEQVEVTFEPVTGGAGSEAC